MADEQMTLAQAQHEPLVEVRLVADREFKEDCCAGTGVVWRGKGDIQLYPKRLWFKLANHPDVWELANPGDPNAPSAHTSQQRQRDESVAEAERVRRNAEALAAVTSETRLSEEAAAEALRQQGLSEAATKRAEAAGEGVDLHVLEVEAVPPVRDGQVPTPEQARTPDGLRRDPETDEVIDPQDPANNPEAQREVEALVDQAAQIKTPADADKFDYAALTPQVQAAMSQDKLIELNHVLDLGVNPRKREDRFREEVAVKLAERAAQAHEQSDTTGVDD